MSKLTWAFFLSLLGEGVAKRLFSTSCVSRHLGANQSKPMYFHSYRSLFGMDTVEVDDGADELSYSLSIARLPSEWHLFHFF
jgi:hypothetical protein